jgi:pullulanase
VFKFRIDDGRWLAPPAGAPNRDGDNLRFAPDARPQRLKAELAGAFRVDVLRLEGTQPLSSRVEDYELRDARGRGVRVTALERIDDARVLLRPSRPLDTTRVYFLTCRPAGLRTVCSFDGWMRRLRSDRELGANYDAAARRTAVRVFAPRATAVRLYLYHARVGDAPYETARMRRGSDGVWEALLAGNREGDWYDFTVHGPDDPGNEFFEQHPARVTDPYARVSDDSYGRCRIWPRQTPATPLRGGVPRMEDVIAYEVHVEDFTLQLTGLDSARRGTFAGFGTPGLRNARGEPIGIDHLVDLGINTVHLLPVQEYLHFPDAEWQAAFLHDPYMIERGIHETNYDWGYRTSHAFALESRYRTRGSEPGAQNREFRDLVQALHDRGIAVVVDVVFNHTAERMDGRELYFGFRVFDRHAYYRTGPTLDFIGDYGTEVKSEDRPMTARWIIDQCAALVDEYGVDGFRVDLAGLTDKQTLRALKRRIGADKIVYGEPWIASADPAYEAQPDWNWYKADAPITFFQDDTRNALCGPPDNPLNKRTDRGYAGGNGRRDAAKRAIANAFPDERTPNDGINYLDIHDNWALADRFAVRDWDGRLGVEEDRYRIAAAMLLTSLGPVVLHGGSEFLRSKGNAPLEEKVFHTASGPIFLHGKRDTYNLRRANEFEWENLGRNTADGAACNYGRMNAYWRGLIALRRSEAGAVFRVGGQVPADYIRWYEPADSLALGYAVGGRVFVAVNTSDRESRLSAVVLPPGEWRLVADGDTAGTTPIDGRAWSQLAGDRPCDVTLPPASVRIWVRR